MTGDRPPQAELGWGARGSEFRSGFVSLVGRPNAGKSTLLNQILRRKVSITSSRPQTTRNAVRGVLTTDDAQLIFIDTPGLHKPRTTLGERLNRVVRTTLAEVDAVALLVDAAQGIGRGDAFIAEELKDIRTPVIAVLNKIDLLTPADLVRQRERMEMLGEGWTVLGVSARVGAGVPELVDALTEHLPEGPLYYPPDMWSDQPEVKLIAELVREKALELTREELPHSIAVVVENVDPGEEGELVEVEAIIYVERQSQKGIIIGKGGSMLREIGSRARRDIEVLLGSRVYLHLRVKVERDWQKRGMLIQRFGYGT